MRDRCIPAKLVLVITFLKFVVHATLNRTSNHSIHTLNHGYIPLMSVSMNVDPKNYVARLIKSIDFPVKRILVQIGAPDDEFRNILFHLTPTTVYCLLSTL